MEENMNKKELVNINKNSIFYKIKQFFKNIFNKNKAAEDSNFIEENTNYSTEKENGRNSFIEAVKNIENEETELLELQKKYRSGEIKEEDLSEEQISSLCKLFDEQIAALKKSNQIKRQQLMENKQGD